MLLYGLLYNNFYLVIKNSFGPNKPEVDTGFQVRWVPTHGGGAGGGQHTILLKFPKNCMKLRKIFGVPP